MATLDSSRIWVCLPLDTSRLQSVPLKAERRESDVPLLPEIMCPCMYWFANLSSRSWIRFSYDKHCSFFAVSID
uniref:Uncharacterized protein n=1 Tax=Arundo donax TaxID=35708 RepID=A0A0A9CR72_ARUDO